MLLPHDHNGDGVSSFSPLGFHLKLFGKFLGVSCFSLTITMVMEFEFLYFLGLSLTPSELMLKQNSLWATSGHLVYSLYVSKSKTRSSERWQ